MDNKQFQHIDCVCDKGILILTVKDEQIREWEQSQALRNEFVASIGQTTAPRVVVNMANVKFLASCGFLPLVSLNTAVNNSGGRMVICGLSDFVRKVLSSTQMLINPKSSRGIFEECATLSDAISALG